MLYAKVRLNVIYPAYVKRYAIHINFTTLAGINAKSTASTTHNKGSAL